MPAGTVLVVSRFIVPDDNDASIVPEDGEDFASGVGRLTDALAARPGYVRSQLARAVDDPSRWVLVSEWEGVGAWRRALSAYDVRIAIMPVMALAEDEPAVYEIPD